MKKLFVGILSLVTMSVLFTSCLKSDNTTYPQPVDPALEKDTIAKFIARHGYNMVEDQNAKGYMYEILNPGSPTDTISNEKPIVTIKYKGTLLNDVVFDESSNAKFDLRLTSLIPGFSHALFKIGKGGHIRFVTPSAYAYGTRSQNKIPANSPLFFDIELIDVTAQ